MSRLVVVSNRVPVPTDKKPPQGGLAVAVLSALESRGGLWFGWNGKVASDQSVSRTRYGNVDFATLALSRKDYDDYYRGFSNRVMWPVLHTRLDRMEYKRTYENGYRRVNQFLAESLVPLLRPDDTLWVHDYHLIPLGLALRRAGCRQRIGFFLHTPFPPSDVFRALPNYRGLLMDFGAYDLVGFQTDVDHDGFLASVHYGVPGAKTSARSVRIGTEPTRTGVFPISIDVDDVVESAARGRASSSGRRLIASLNSRNLIMGVDRLDYSKGLLARFHAVETMLQRYPSLQRHFIYLQIAQPSRGDVPEYQQMRHELDGAAGEINGRFSEYDWMPVRYLHKGFSHSTILGFLSIARVCLVTPLRDGMNLVAKEFVASQRADDPGVLVLSELAGAARELTDALIVNPYDLVDVADGLAKALDMPVEERRKRWESMMRVLKKNDIHRWRQRFLRTLDETRAETPPQHENPRSMKSAPSSTRVDLTPSG